MGRVRLSVRFMKAQLDEMDRFVAEHSAPSRNFLIQVAVRNLLSGGLEPDALSFRRVCFRLREAMYRAISKKAEELGATESTLIRYAVSSFLARNQGRAD